MVLSQIAQNSAIAGALIYSKIFTEDTYRFQRKFDTVYRESSRTKVNQKQKPQIYVL